MIQFGSSPQGRTAPRIVCAKVCDHIEEVDVEICCIFMCGVALTQRIIPGASISAPDGTVPKDGSSKETLPDS